MLFGLENLVIYDSFDFFNDHDDDEYIIFVYIKHKLYSIGYTMYNI